MASTTIQDRLRYLLEKTGLDQTALSLRAGLSPNFIGSILARPVGHPDARKNIGGRAAQGLSNAAKVSVSWLISGTGTPEGIDVAREAPPSHFTRTLEDLPDWPRIAMDAVEREKGLMDFAVMAVGEEIFQGDAPELTVYYVLARAEKIAKATATNFKERERLDAKLRSFLKENVQKRRTAPPTESGKHRTTPPKK